LSELTASAVGPTTSRRQRRSVTNTTEIQKKATAATASFKRPRNWMLAFGWSLAACAGLINVVAFRSWGLYVSHVTGSTTAIGMRIEGFHQGRHDYATLQEAILLVVSFLLGAFACGVLVDKNQVHFGGKAFYGFALVGEACLLVSATVVEPELLAACLASAACGLQNAMCTSHFGAVVRTTHVTGTMTDIGSTLGRILMIYLRKGLRSSRLNALERAEVGVDARKLLVLLPMWLFFLFGCIAGAYLETQMQVYALLIPASLTFSVGTSYMLFRQRLKGYLKRLEQERLSAEVEAVKDSLERTHGYLRELNKTAAAGDEAKRQMAAELESGLQDMLETMRGVEENVESLCSSSSSSSSSGDEPARQRSAPGKV